MRPSLAGTMPTFTIVSFSGTMTIEVHSYLFTGCNASDKLWPIRGAEVPYPEAIYPEAISGNLGQSPSADCSIVHRHQEVLLISAPRASLRGDREEGGLKRAAPTRSVRSLRPSTQEVAVLPSPTLF